MRRNIKVKPGKTQSAMGFTVGIIFVGIGLFVVIPIFGPFGIFWTLIAVAITVTNGMNAFGKREWPAMRSWWRTTAEAAMHPLRSSGWRRPGRSMTGA